MTDIPTPSTGSNQTALTKPGALGTTANRRLAKAAPGRSSVLDLDPSYDGVHPTAWQNETSAP